MGVVSGGGVLGGETVESGFAYQTWAAGYATAVQATKGDLLQ